MSRPVLFGIGPAVLLAKAEQLSLFGARRIANEPGNCLGTDKLGRGHWRAQPDTPGPASEPSRSAPVPTPPADEAKLWAGNAPMRSGNAKKQRRFAPRARRNMLVQLDARVQTIDQRDDAMGAIVNTALPKLHPELECQRGELVPAGNDLDQAARYLSLLKRTDMCKRIGAYGAHLRERRAGASPVPPDSKAR